MKSIFFRGMLAHYLRKLFLCESNHKSVFLKLNIDVLLRHFKFTDFLLSTYTDTLLGTLSLGFKYLPFVFLTPGMNLGSKVEIVPEDFHADSNWPCWFRTLT